MKIVTIVGARPQFIKAATVSRAIAQRNLQTDSDPVNEVIVHTGQHFDHNMSQTFFDQLAIPAPKHNLNIHGGGHGIMTGRMLEQLEQILTIEQPDWVLIYGDTNSTLAGALAAIKLHIPVAHVEAGLRSFNMKMPEEVNRIVADSVSSLLLCPTETAVRNLQREGHHSGVHNVGDVMYDASLHMCVIADHESTILADLKLEKGKFILSTCHRAENTDDPNRLTAILSALNEISTELPVVLPLHPRTRKMATQHGIAFGSGVRVVEPVSYLDMVKLESGAAAVATDSGGVQKEAYFYRVPCVTLREETEWLETLNGGWNRLAPPMGADIVQAIREALSGDHRDYASPYGDGRAAEKIVSMLESVVPDLPVRSG
ncbi:non-hydrolyzing UDP-N-acetylglucosamine 2-epimerase [Pelovirga terrestris]|uniref:UDP-N-acetylglucosamine 2-epimerase (Non-hydrolyzing) n=1 Tax=Pelovirga terrestris TaxID=2771352 RepID=A0A8J6R4V3_9BACT|nr:UDP-N-acetylglucosamine 2-epimerase (non-hydrolyzing) [Pelovirga terrestris]MBD1399624.1 UDP-N-acetylglucosamine 2-epimerase (non-hydrolyzing) [Pelovirga terrestris]